MGKLYDVIVQAITMAEKRGETRYQIAQRNGREPGDAIAHREPPRPRAFPLDTLERLVDALGIELRLKKS